MLFKDFFSSVRIILKIKNHFKIKRSKRKAFFIFISKFSKYKVVFGVIRLAYIKRILNKVEKNPFHFIDLHSGVDRKSLGKVVIFKAFIIPDFRGKYHSRKNNFSPVQII
jgi:hypothetical protein